MSPDDFESVSRFVRERSGLVLTRDKTYLLENRLMPVVRDLRFKSALELVNALSSGDTAIEMAVIDAMMAKDTAFFRDWKPFAHFRNVFLPNVRVARGLKKQFRILCAGVSTGQEAYSCAMTIRDLLPSFPDWQAEVVGIDISADAIATAVRGIYTQFDVQKGLPVRTLLQYFTKQDEAWALTDVVRATVKFKVWNLLDDLFSLGRFDAIFCRNVLIYFDLKTKLQVLQKLGGLLSDDGVLYLGMREAITGMPSGFRAVDIALGVYTAEKSGRTAAFSLAHKA